MTKESTVAASKFTVDDMQRYINGPISGDAIATISTAELHYRAEVAILSSAELSREAIGWCLDCFSEWWDEELSAVEAIRYIRSTYEGGIVAFYMASRVLLPVITRTGK